MFRESREGGNKKMKWVDGKHGEEGIRCLKKLIDNITEEDIDLITLQERLFCILGDMFDLILENTTMRKCSKHRNVSEKDAEK